MLQEAVHGTCSTVHASTKPKDCKSDHDPKHIVFKQSNAATTEHNYTVTKSPEKHKAKKKVGTCEPRKVGNGLL